MLFFLLRYVYPERWFDSEEHILRHNGQKTGFIILKDAEVDFFVGFAEFYLQRPHSRLTGTASPETR